MFKVNYYEKEIERDSTYDDAYATACTNNDTKWINYYAYLQEKYDMCYNVESLTIDTADIERMRFDVFSNGILMKLYQECKGKHIIETEEQYTIVNDSKLAEEIIYNIMKAQWLIDERLVDPYNPELKQRENYFKALLSVSDDTQDVKTQFRNKLLEHFLKSYTIAMEKRAEQKKLDLHL